MPVSPPQPSDHDGTLAETGTILLLGNFRTSLAIARSLGRKGYRIIVGRDVPTEVDRSRYTTEIWPYAFDEPNVETFLQTLAIFLESRPEITQIFPVSQDFLLALLPHADAIDRPLVSVAPRLILTCTNKTGMAELARELQVPQAPFGRATTLDELVSQSQSIGYPCIVKPDNSSQTKDKAYVLKSRAHLESLFPEWPEWLDSLMVQALAPGVRYNRYFIADRGEILRYLDIKTLRTDRLNGTGYGVEGISVPPLALLDKPTERFIARLDYSGIGCVQYLVDELRESLCFLEINPRLGGNYAFTHACGLDQLGALLDHCGGRPMTDWRAPFTYPAGKRYAWSSGDIFGLLEALDRNQIGVRGSVAWLYRTARAAARADSHLTFDRHDLRPSLDILRWIGRDIRTLIRDALFGRPGQEDPGP